MPKELTPEERRQLFENRGIKFSKDTHKKDSHKIQEIGYYKLKEFAYPFSYVNRLDQLRYINLKFSKLLLRYYQDKHLRMDVLNAIEDIEVSVNSNIADILGKYGPFGYLKFNLWANKQSLSKECMKSEQDYLKNAIKTKLKKHMQLKDLYDPKNQNKHGFPSIWLVANILTFGNTVYLVKDMSTHNRRKLSNKYDCTPTELISWLQCLNFIRNVCAHNDDLVDLKLRTKPMAPKVFNKLIIKNNKGYSNSIAIVVFIVKYLMLSVNPRYNFKMIASSLYEIIHKRNLLPNINNPIARQLGFTNRRAIKFLFMTRSHFLQLKRLSYKHVKF